MKKLSLPLKSIIILSLTILVIIFATCNKAEIETLDLKNQVEYRSVSIVNGTYKIDSSIAMSNWKKEKLIVTLETENLIEKTIIEDIPDFIKAFLDDISVNKTFDMTISGEEWQDGPWIRGFDKQTKDIVNATSFVSKPFPTKQLIYCGIGKNMVMISYYTGGIRIAQHVMVIKLEDKHIIDLWFDNNSYGCNSGFGGTKKDAIIKYIKTMNNSNC